MAERKTEKSENLTESCYRTWSVLTGFCIYGSGWISLDFFPVFFMLFCLGTIASYRLLITSQRSVSDEGQYSEAQILGYI